MNAKKQLSGTVLVYVCISALFTSCVQYNKLQYFENNNLTTETNIRKQKLIMPFDKLYVKVLSTDEKTAAIFNFSDEVRSYSQNNENLISYLVDESGNITFPFAGKVNVAGLTIADAGEKIQKALGEYLTNIAIIVKFVDNKITVLGEVNRQGEYSFTDDKITVFNAVSLAGGLTKFGNRKKIILIREENKQINFYKLDLSDTKIAGSKYYYLEPRDIIVVEPLKAIAWSYENRPYSTVLTTISTILGAATTTIAILYYIN